MPHLPFFGLRNFKAFEGEHHFHLKNITFLIGKNSSGKSSLIDGLRVFNKEEINNLRPFKELINDSTKDDFFSLEFNLFPANFIKKFDYESEKFNKSHELIARLSSYFIFFKIELDYKYEISNLQELIDKSSEMAIILDLIMEEYDLFIPFYKREDDRGNDGVELDIEKYINYCKSIIEKLEEIKNLKKAEDEEIARFNKKSRDLTRSEVESFDRVKLYYELGRIKFDSDLLKFITNKFNKFVFLNENTMVGKPLQYKYGIKANYISFESILNQLNTILEIDGTLEVMNNELVIRKEKQNFRVDKYFGRGVKRLLKYIVYNFQEIIENDNKDSKVFIIEEPEANLHPAIQSKLADLFVYLSNKYNFQFIIETHSEYIIRRMQYLMAHSFYKESDDSIHKVTPDMANIYYFNGPGHDEHAYEINFKIDGTLSREFGTGFFDVVDDLAFNLFMLRNQSIN